MGSCMRWLLLYSIVWCLGLDGRDICLQHLVSGSGSLQLQDAENLCLCSYHEFFEQVFCWLSCGTDTNSGTDFRLFRGMSHINQLPTNVLHCAPICITGWALPAIISLKFSGLAP